MNKKHIILQAVLVFGLFIVVLVSLTAAWFTSSTWNTTEEVTLEVSASNTFDLSLDGEYFGRDLRIKFYDDLYGNNLNTLLKDLSPVITTNGNVQSMTLYSPVKNDYTGEPITTGVTWQEARKTDLKYDESTKTYYVINDSSNVASYIEFDLWVRSDSELDIYLGNESYVKAVDTSDEANTIYAMYANEYIYEALNEKIGYSLGINKEELFESKIITNEDNEVYVYEYDSVNQKYDFIAYRVTTKNDQGNDVYKFYNLDGTEASALNKTTAENYILKDYGLLVHETNQVAKSVKYYYDSIGNIVGIVEKIGSTTTSYSSVENYNSATPTSDTIKILTQSPYNYLETYKNEDLLSYSIKYTFSKNLAVGAMRVAFSEIDLNDNSEHLKYIWNPQPTYKISAYSNGAKFEIDQSKDEDTYYYTYDSTTKTYTQESCNENFPNLVYNGAIQTTTNNVLNNETPLCSIDKSSSSEFGIRKLRVRFYLDGTDNEADGVLLSTSETGNGKLFAKLQFVSYYDNIVIDNITSKISNVGTHEYYFAAHRSKEEVNGIVDYSHPEHGYTWNINNSIIATRCATQISYDSVTITNGCKVTFNKSGVLVVYATDETGRTGAYTIVVNDISISYVQGTGDDINKFTLTATEEGTIRTDVTYSVVSGNCTINNNVLVYNDLSETAVINAYTDTGIGTVQIIYSANN